MQAVHGPVPAVTLTAATGVRLLTVSAPCAALGGLGAALVFLVAHQALIDDAYITLDYARSLAQHGQWALVPGHPANTATSPLNVLLLAGLIVLSGHPVVSVGILLIVSLAATGAALSAICARLERSSWLAAIAVSLLVVNPLLISTIGLETYLGIALIAILGAAVVARRPVAVGLVCGLLVLTRADLAAFALAALIAVIAGSPTRTRARRAAQVMGVAGVVALPWFVVSWWWLGSAVPDTLLFKTSETWAGNSFAVGLWHYRLAYPLAVALSVVPAALGLVVLAVWSAVGDPPADWIRWGTGGGMGARCVTAHHGVPATAAPAVPLVLRAGDRIVEHARCPGRRNTQPPPAMDRINPRRCPDRSGGGVSRRPAMADHAYLE